MMSVQTGLGRALGARGRSTSRPAVRSMHCRWSSPRRYPGRPSGDAARGWTRHGVDGVRFTMPSAGLGADIVTGRRVLESRHEGDAPRSFGAGVSRRRPSASGTVPSRHRRARRPRRSSLVSATLATADIAPSSRSATRPRCSRKSSALRRDRLRCGRNSRADPQRGASIFRRAGRCAARALVSLQVAADGVLVRDDRRHYRYSQEFEPPAEACDANRIFCAGRAAPTRRASAPHERTTGPKLDRIALSRATRAMLSPQFMLTPIPNGPMRISVRQGCSVSHRRRHRASDVEHHRRRRRRITGALTFERAPHSGRSPLRDGRFAR